MDARRWLKGKPGFNPVRGRVTLLGISLTVAVTSHGSSQEVSSSLRDSAMTAARVILANDSASLVDKALAAKVLGLEELSKRYQLAWAAARTRDRDIERLRSAFDAIGATDVGIEAETAHDLLNSPDGAAAFYQFYEDELLELQLRNPSEATRLQLEVRELRERRKKLERELAELGGIGPQETQPGGEATVATFLESLIGASVVADDGAFLGIVTDCLNLQSLCNELGRYGSSLSSKSIHNSLSRYGSTISRVSAYNSLAISPPRIVKGDRTVAYLTKNSMKSPAVDPDVLIQWLKSGRTLSAEELFDCAMEHYVTSISEDGSVISLDDGSVWQVSSVDRLFTRIWLTFKRVTVCDGTMTSENSDQEVWVTRIR